MPGAPATGAPAPPAPPGALPPPPPPPPPAPVAKPAASSTDNLPPHLREIAALRAKMDAAMGGAIGDDSVVMRAPPLAPAAP